MLCRFSFACCVRRRAAAMALRSSCPAILHGGWIGVEGGGGTEGVRLNKLGIACSREDLKLVPLHVSCLGSIGDGEERLASENPCLVALRDGVCMCGRAP
jgi:hypothetical protein